MSREIKFRGLCTEANYWVYGFYCRIQEDNSEYTHIIKEDTTRHISNVKSTSYEVFGESVGEFTGLKDNNGKEIYEGDIANDRVGEQVKVFWSNDLARFEYKSIHDESYGDSIELNDCKHWEVIGNVFENPELLK